MYSPSLQHRPCGQRLPCQIHRKRHICRHTYQQEPEVYAYVRVCVLQARRRKAMCGQSKAVTTEVAIAAVNICNSTVYGDFI